LINGRKQRFDLIELTCIVLAVGIKDIELVRDIPLVVRKGHVETFALGSRRMENQGEWKRAPDEWEVS
jgi:hypothetical protein